MFIFGKIIGVFKMTMTTEAKAWIRRSKSADEIVRIVPETANGNKISTYHLFTAYEQEPEHLGMILFDTQGYWIYDGSKLNVAEQEQLAKFIIHYKGSV